jgi:hypothetical protein
MTAKLMVCGGKKCCGGKMVITADHVSGAVGAYPAAHQAAHKLDMTRHGSNVDWLCRYDVTRQSSNVDWLCRYLLVG